MRSEAGLAAVLAHRCHAVEPPSGADSVQMRTPRRLFRTLGDSRSRTTRGEGTTGQAFPTAGIAAHGAGGPPSTAEASRGWPRAWERLPLVRQWRGSVADGALAAPRSPAPHDHDVKLSRRPGRAGRTSAVAVAGRPRSPAPGSAPGTGVRAPPTGRWRAGAAPRCPCSACRGASQPG